MNEEKTQIEKIKKQLLKWRAAFHKSKASDWQRHGHTYKEGATDIINDILDFIKDETNLPQ